MARTKKSAKALASAAEEVTPPSPAENTVSSTIPESVATHAVYQVVKDGQVVREYTVELHGPEAQSLAQEYATKTGGTVQ